MTVYIRGVNLAEISGPARPANCFCSARPVSELILQNLYNGLNIFVWRGDKILRNFVKYDIICDLVSVQSQTCWILKTKYYF